jgi:hypothetical protein
MLSPALHNLIAEAHIAELHRGAQTSFRSEVNCPDAMGRPGAIRRAINRVLLGHGAVTKEACHG